MLTERRRSLRLLGDRSLAGFWLARLLERAGDWIFLITVLVVAWNSTADASLAAWALALWFAPRLIVLGIFDAWTKRLSPSAWVLLSAARAVVVLVVLIAYSLGTVPVSELL